MDRVNEENLREIYADAQAFAKYHKAPFVDREHLLYAATCFDPDFAASYIGPRFVDICATHLFLPEKAKAVKNAVGDGVAKALKALGFELTIAERAPDPEIPLNPEAEQALIQAIREWDDSEDKNIARRVIVAVTRNPAYEEAVEAEAEPPLSVAAAHASTQDPAETQKTDAQGTEQAQSSTEPPQGSEQAQPPVEPQEQKPAQEPEPEIIHEPETAQQLSNAQDSEEAEGSEEAFSSSPLPQLRSLADVESLKNSPLLKRQTEGRNTPAEVPPPLTLSGVQPGEDPARAMARQLLEAAQAGRQVKFSIREDAGPAPHPSHKLAEEESKETGTPDTAPQGSSLHDMFSGSLFEKGVQRPEMQYIPLIRFDDVVAHFVREEASGVQINFLGTLAARLEEDARKREQAKLDKAEGTELESMPEPGRPESAPEMEQLQNAPGTGRPESASGEEPQTSASPPENAPPAPSSPSMPVNFFSNYSSPSRGGFWGFWRNRSVTL